MSSDPEVKSRHVGQVIHHSPAKVYQFASDPENLPTWAAGLGRS